MVRLFDCAVYGCAVVPTWAVRVVLAARLGVQDLLEGLELLHALAGAARHRVQRVLGDVDRHAGLAPELSGDVMDRGIVLTGGGALLRGLDERLRRETGMPIHIAEDPLDSVALGSGKCVEEFEALQQVLDAQPRR